MKKLILATVASIISSSALAQDSCDMLLQHGINNITRYQSSEHTIVYKYFKHCQVDHSRSSDRAVSAADGGIFGFGSASASLNIDQKRERVTNFCINNKDFAERNQNFFAEAQTLSERALNSWEQCISMSRKSIKITMSPQGDHAEYVHFEIDSTHDGDLNFLGVKEAEYKCETAMSVDGEEVETAFPVPIRNANIQIDCTRSAPEVSEVDGKGKIQYKLGYISINTDGPALAVSFPEVISEYYVTPPNSVIAFNSTRCPAGWVEYEPAFGRFIRGIDPLGQGIDPNGIRAPGDLQDDDVGAHSHVYRGGGSSGRTSADRGDDQRELWHGGDSGQNNTRGTESNPAGETRPKNVSLLFCERR